MGTMVLARTQLAARTALRHLCSSADALPGLRLLARC